MQLTITHDIQRIFFTSDTHYGHANICSAASNWQSESTQRQTRQFPSLDAMNTALVNNINGVVGEDDILIHLGDWSFGGFDNIAEFRNRIHCRNIHLVYGNHDHHQRNNRDNIQSLFSSCHDYLPLDLRIHSMEGKNSRVTRHRIVCMHFPIASWDGMSRGDAHFHGHVHLPPHQRLGKGRSLDVGVDGNGLTPIKVGKALDMVYKQPIHNLSLPSDHHQ